MNIIEYSIRPTAAAGHTIVPTLVGLLTATLLLGPTCGPVHAAAIERPHISVELISEHESIRPGHPLSAALRLVPDPGWHVYWRNPGDSGLPTQVAWALPDGFQAGDLQWPFPNRFLNPPYTTYGYDRAVLLPVSIAPPADLHGERTVTIGADADWLVCHAELCVPGQADLSLRIPVEDRAPYPDSRWIQAFGETREQLPRRLAGDGLNGWNAHAYYEGDRIVVELDPPEGSDPSLEGLALYPVDKDVLQHSAAQRFTQTDGKLRIEVVPEPDRGPPVEQLCAVLVGSQPFDFAGTVHALELNLEVHATAGTVAATATVAGATVAQPGGTAAAAPDTAGAGTGTAVTSDGGSGVEPETAPAAGSTTGNAADNTSNHGTSNAASTQNDQATTLPTALLLAFVGGLILNLMPCVFPVLSLKILGFVNSAHHEPAAIRRHGHVFAAGVLVSFWVLAGLLLVLRAGGRELGWGFQLQSPAFVAAMAFLLFAVALNLFGVFEIGNSLTGLAGRADTASAGYRGSFTSGVLATILATPCTAPFMGVALGYALSQPPAAALAVFTMLGLGLAAPYVVLSWAPGLLKKLPRPGAWMETFKQAMAFPVLATVAWLVWVLGQQVGNDGVLRLLGGMILVSLAIWAAGLSWWSAAGARRAVVRTVTAVSVLAGLYMGASAANLPAVSTACAADCALPSDQGWAPYNVARLADLRAEGRTVFVDFTAAWCLTCKLNERVALADADVMGRLAELDAVTMKADWTSGDPVITRALESFGRSGVPLYVLYHGGPDTEPIVLPSILTADLVLDALATLS